jgi:hypothetical protein
MHRRCACARLAAQAGRKFHLRAYVAVWPHAGGAAGSAALWSGVEVRLATRAYTGDTTDKLQARAFMPCADDAALRCTL